ncbi:hypothetical protein HOD38_03165 [archaeon]|jgi:hypothetical protein|nr:hypothetical protein [archaeon]MBT4397239.1 hypothetical protein [archaeon]MBT4440619.1 hypothetical protein [archaeon]
MKLDIPRILQGPSSCGHSSLLQVLAYYGTKLELKEVVNEISSCEVDDLKLGASECELGLFAMKRDFKSTVISLDVRRFDATWFDLSKEELKKKLELRSKFLHNLSPEDFKEGQGTQYLDNVTKYYSEYFEKDGKVKFLPISKELIKKYIDKKIPVIALVSSQLYFKKARKYNGKFDDIKGKPTGHWIVVSGYTDKNFIITDPADDLEKDGNVEMEQNYLISSINTYGPVILIIEK